MDICTPQLCMHALMFRLLRIIKTRTAHLTRSVDVCFMHEPHTWDSKKLSKMTKPTEGTSFLIDWHFHLI